MKIGEFAKVCNTKISVLRHYDKLGLLSPVFIDPFTEYRYYATAQIAVFERISELKEMGFTLAQIKFMLHSGDRKRKELLYEQKRKEIAAILHTLDTRKKEILGGIVMEDPYIPFVEDFDKTFVNDERVVGKWEVLNSVEGADKHPTVTLGDGNHLLYFLPEGQAYWCMSWTKGKLIFNDGESCFSNDYVVEESDGRLYMTISFKSFDFARTGELTDIRLRKLDSGRYTAQEIAKKDDINKPFVADEQVIGTWKAFAYIDETDNRVREFLKDPYGQEAWSYEKLFFKEIIFEQGGHCTQVYGEEILTGDEQQTWTKGFVLRKWNSTACAYQIHEIAGREYLIIEWKSGDYRWGGRPTSYYAFIRA